MVLRFSTVTGRHLFSGVLLIAWLVHGAPLIFSSTAVDQLANGLEKYAYEQEQSIRKLNEKGLTDIDVGKVGAAVRRELQTLRTVDVVVTVLGFAAAIMALLAFPLWWVAVVVTSAAYLSVWYSLGVLAHVPVVQAYQLKWAMAEALNTRVRFFIDDIFVPLVLMGAIVYVVSDLMSRKMRSAS